MSVREHSIASLRALVIHGTECTRVDGAHPSLHWHFKSANPEELGSALAPYPHLQRDWAPPAHICNRTGLPLPTSAPGLGSSRGAVGSGRTHSHCPRECLARQASASREIRRRNVPPYKDAPGVVVLSARCRRVRCCVGSLGSGPDHVGSIPAYAVPAYAVPAYAVPAYAVPA